MACIVSVIMLVSSVCMSVYADDSIVVPDIEPTVTYAEQISETEETEMTSEETTQEDTSEVGLETFENPAPNDEVLSDSGVDTEIVSETTSEVSTETTEITTEATSETTTETVELMAKNDIMPIAEMPQNENVVYIDGANGDDESSGLSDAEAVQTMEKAIEIAQKEHTRTGYNITIKVLSTINVYSTQKYVGGSYVTTEEYTWTFSDYMLVDATECNGNVIYVKPGFSNSHCSLTVNNLKIYGNTDNTGIYLHLAGTNTRSQAQLNTCKFYNFKVGCDATFGSSLIDNCEFRDCNIALGSPSSVTGSLFVGCNTGVEAYRGGSHIESSIFATCRDGISVQNTYKVTLTSCKFYSCSRYGISLDGSSSINATGCEFQNNQDGVHFFTLNKYYDAESVLTNCKFTYNTRYGLYFGFDPGAQYKDLLYKLEINDCIFSDNTTAGIYQQGGILQINSVKLSGKLESHSGATYAGMAHPHALILSPSAEDPRIYIGVIYSYIPITLKQASVNLGNQPGLDGARSQYIIIQSSDEYKVTADDKSHFIEQRYGYWYHYVGNIDMPYIQLCAEHRTTYHRNDGSVSDICYATTVNSDNVTHVKIPTSIENNLKREGYSFGGWYSTPECAVGTEFDPYTESMYTQDNEVYAKWIPNTYTVTFYKNDGTGSIYTAVEGTAVEGFTLPENPTRHGYTFKGWFYDETCTEGQEVDTRNPYIDNGEVKLYAKWVEKPAPILTITKTVDKSVARHGDTLVYTIVVSNTGGEATDIVIADVLPKQLRFISTDPYGEDKNGTVTWTIPTLAENTSKTIKLTTQII